MKVAIVGGGLAGLACAWELERRGINPVIFEKRDYTGGSLIDAVAMLRIFNRVYSNPVDYLKKKYDLRITALSPVRELVMAAPEKETTVKGDLGYIFLRGAPVASLENQIVSQIKTPVQVGNKADVLAIKNNFDYVVAATGEGSAPMEMKAWTQTFTAFVRTAVVLGSFRTDQIKMWINTRFAKNGYCYLIPNNDRQANLSIVVNDITHDEVDYYWKQFLMEEDIPYIITETRDHEVKVGFTEPVKIDNVYFVGNSGGFIDDLMGFGTLGAIESGILASRSIADNIDYNSACQPILKKIRKLHEYRKAMNTFDDNDFNTMMSVLDSPAVKKITYENRRFKASQGAFLARIYNTLRHMEK